MIVGARTLPSSCGSRRTAIAQCVKLGTAEEGWTWERAQRELENVLVEVRRGIWKPAEPEPEPAPVADENPVFHNFASTWFEDDKGEWTENTRLDYQWQHLASSAPVFPAPSPVADHDRRGRSLPRGEGPRVRQAQ